MHWNAIYKWIDPIKICTIRAFGPESSFFILTFSIKCSTDTIFFFSRPRHYLHLINRHFLSLNISVGKFQKQKSSVSEKELRYRGSASPFLKQGVFEKRTKHHCLYSSIAVDLFYRNCSRIRKIESSGIDYK